MIYEKNTPPSQWGWDGTGAFGAEKSDYEVLRDTIIYAFNPPDDDVAEPSLMTTTLDRVHAFIVAQPCTCPSDAGPPEWNGDPCARCEVLGRARDEVIER